MGRLRPGNHSGGSNMRRAMVLAALVSVGTFGAGNAFGATTRDAAGDQYGATPVIGASSTPTAATTPTTAAATTTSAGKPSTPAKGAEPASGSGKAPSTKPSTPPSKNGAAPEDGSDAAGPGASGSGATEGLPANRVAVLEFGKAPKKLQENIAQSIDQAGLQTLFLGQSTKPLFTAFMASPLLGLLSGGGTPNDSGRAFGAQLVNPTPLAEQAFTALFGPTPAFVPAIRAVLTRRANLSTDKVAFLKGVATGLKSTDIPLAYVERSDVKKSFIKSFEKLHVLTVSDVDKPAGKLRLAKILLGQITTQKAVDAVNTTPASAITTDADGGAGATPWVVLAVLLGGVAFMATGTLRRRNTRGSVA
ncbi:MAG: hypothetical protein JWM31_2760 [Solirubrobacterales bacterium]|nr:hypothetical protein [Solirubrobacterales bacterium]